MSVVVASEQVDKEIEDDCISERKQQKGGALGVSLSAQRGVYWMDVVAAPEIG